MDSKFLNWKEPILKQENQLPHWQQERTLQFVTWHLGDALPVSTRRRIAQEREKWLQAHPSPWDPVTEQEYFKLFSERIQKLLDSGIGNCIQRNPKNREVITASLHYLDGVDFDLDCFVIMPNHVHVMFTPLTDKDLSKIVHRIKRHTSQKINQLNSTSGSIWMRDYWDRMIRGRHHYNRVRKYILENPTKAGLKPGQYTYWEAP